MPGKVLTNIIQRYWSEKEKRHHQQELQQPMEVEREYSRGALENIYLSHQSVKMRHPLPSICKYICIYWRTLQREFKKTGADVDITTIDQKMSLTFAERRKLIVIETNSLAEIIEKFPWLQYRCEVKLVFFYNLFLF